MAQGPTQGIREDQWRAHKGAATVLRVAMLALPVAVSLMVTIVAGRIVPRPNGLMPLVTWWVAITAVSTVSLIGTARLLRRFLPVIALLRLSLVFPDEAPSRFKMALRMGTTAQLQRQVTDGAVAPSLQSHAERLLALASSIGDHDRLTRGHSERVRAYTNLIGEELGLDPDERELLHWSALLHDIGKLEVPAEILNKNGRPDEAEWKVLQQHPAAAASYLAPLTPWLGEWRNAATEHHERWDGGGYPRGLRGDQISMAGRIVAVADAYDTMTSVRSYKKAMAPADARAEIARCSGSQFDPAVVRAFLAVSVGDLGKVMGPVSWLAQVPLLALAPSSTVPALTNAVVTTTAAASIAVTTFVGGIAAPSAPVTEIDTVSAIVELDEMPAPRALAFAAPSPLPSTSPGNDTPPDDPAVDPESPTPTPTPTPTVTTTPGPEPTTGIVLARPTPTPDSLTPTPTPGGAPTATPEAGPTSPPTATPTPRPTATPAPTATPTPTPTSTSPPTPTPEPPPAGARWYLENPGSGATASSATLPLRATAPTGLSLPNFDTNRNSDLGLTIRKGASSFTTGDSTKIQTWAVNAGTASIDGEASVRLFAAPTNYDWDKTGTVRVALQRCANDLVDCITLGTGETSFSDPILAFFGQVDVDLGDVTAGSTAGRPMTVLRVIVPNSSEDDLWFAYDNSLYPARLDVAG